MDLRQLHTFRLLAQTLSFSQTAVQLNYAQSTVSTQIKSLEKELNVTLFDRLGKNIRLTAAGNNLLIYADKMLDLAGEAKAALSFDEPSGILTITAPETLCSYRIPDVLRRFQAEYPLVQLIFRPRPKYNLQRPLREGYMDVAFIIDQPLQMQDLEITPLVSEQIMLVAYPDHVLVGETAVTAQDLQHEPVLLTETSCGYRQEFERLIKDEGVQLGTKMEFHSVEAIKQCTMAGLGIAFLPEIAIQGELATQKLIPLDWAGPNINLETQLIWHKDKWLSPALRAFLQVVQEVLAD